MHLSQIEHRNQVIRAYFEGRDWDTNGEYALKRRLVLNSKKLFPSYPYVIEDEWEVQPGRTDQGRGDLVFTDGSGGFAVVEVKSLDLESIGRTGTTKRVSNRKKRRMVEEQALRYAEIYQKNLDENQVAANRVKPYLFTNEHETPKEVEF